MEYSDHSYDTTTTLHECNNNDLTFSVKDSSRGKKSETQNPNKVRHVI